MSINYTTIGPITAKLTAEGQKETTEVTVVAFGWNDAEPEKNTGVWVLGKAPGLAFLPANEISSLEPMSGASERAIMMAADALEAVREALVVDVVAAVESRAAPQAREPKSGAPKSSSRRPATPKPPDRKPARRSVKQP